MYHKANLCLWNRDLRVEYCDPVQNTANDQRRILVCLTVSDTAHWSEWESYSRKNHHNKLTSHQYTAPLCFGSSYRQKIKATVARWLKKEWRGHLHWGRPHHASEERPSSEAIKLACGMLFLIINEINYLKYVLFVFNADVFKASTSK